MQESILQSIKRMMGMTDTYTAFDAELIMHINSVFDILYQLGVGDTAFFITGPDEKWSSVIDTNSKLNLVKTYIFMKVKMIFDPPTSSQVTEAFKSGIAELEWRICAEVDRLGTQL